MKALTLTEPYASLVANGDKLVETRSWRTNYRGPVLIHAASTLKGVGGKNGYIEVLHGLPDLALIHLGRNPHHPGATLALPLGFVVGVSYVEDVVEIDEALRRSLEPDELAVGNYADGRYAWILRRAESDFRPFPWKGALGVWDLPDEALPDRIVRACRAIQHAVI